MSCLRQHHPGYHCLTVDQWSISAMLFSEHWSIPLHWTCVAQGGLFAINYRSCSGSAPNFAGQARRLRKHLPIHLSFWLHLLQATRSSPECKQWGQFRLSQLMCPFGTFRTVALTFLPTKGVRWFFYYRIFARIHHVSRRENLLILPVREKSVILCRFGCWNYLHATRVGEASVPGPAASTCVFTIAQVNPTSVYQKSDLIASQGQIVLCSETSATQGVQSIETRALKQLGLSTVWSPPQMAQRPTIQATEDLRGKASGLLAAACYPIRSAQHQEPLALWRAGRYMRTFVTVGTITLQLVQIYGYPSCHPEAKSMTNALCKHACSEALQLDMPTIFAGDFNHPPASLPALQVLLAAGYTTSQQLYWRHYHCEQPPTCRDATYNDGFLCCPTTTQWVQAVAVEQNHIFADHIPVQMTLSLPVTPPTRQIWRLPHSWVPYSPQLDDVEENYRHIRTGTPTTLEQWSGYCERAVHLALKSSHQRDPVKFPFSSLPRAARGRCRARKRVTVPLYQPIRPAGPHQYDPQIDSSTAKFRKAVRQLRRLQSLQRRVNKLYMDASLAPDWQQLYTEWSVIATTMFDGVPFQRWLDSFPDMPLLQASFPTLDYLHDACQLTQHRAQQLEAAERCRQLAARRYERLYDRQWGGHAKAFRSIRPGTNPCLTMTWSTQLLDIQSLRGQGSGLLTCTVPDFRNHHPQAEYSIGEVALLYCNHQQTEIDFFQADVEGEFPERQQLRIRTPVTDSQLVVNELTQYWSKFWLRDSPQEDWSTFQHMLMDTQPLPKLEATLTRMEWRQAIQHLKISTARGICGWFAQELRDLPLEAQDDLYDLMLNHLSAMPPELMRARTIPLGKSKHPDQPALTRPITILSLLYRLWGRATTYKALRYWARTLPEEIVGFLPGRSMANAMVAFQWKLEQTSRFTEASLGGLTLDLTKAFNLIGRRPAAFAMIHYGLPEQWVHFWESSISSMDRVWEVNGSLSEPFQPTTGCPEGDTWSVVAMLALSNVWVNHLRVLPQPVQPLCYADNLGWSATQAAAHGAALQVTKLWADTLRFQIDWKKTWVWASNDEHAHRWTGLQLQHPEMQSVLKVTNARELGYMLAYNKCQNKQTFFARHAEALEQCRRIARLPHPISVKGNLLRAPLSRLLYGTEIHMVSLNHLRQLRTAMARALLGPHTQPNPFLAVAVLYKDILDPHFQVIFHALRAIRRFLWSLDGPGRRHFFLQVVRHAGQPWQIFGPVGTLRYHMDFLGWTITREGLLRTDAFKKLSFLDTPLEVLKQELLLAWEHHILPHLHSRREWKGAPVVNLATTAKIFASLPSEHQKIIAAELTGAYQLQHRKSKWVTDLEDTCPLCGQEDSVYHRRLKCPALQAARLPHQAIVDTLLEHDSILTALPLVFRHPEQCFDHWLHQVDRPPALSDVAQQALEADQAAGHIPLIFTDGSAAPPDCPDAREAAGAAVHLPRSFADNPVRYGSLLEHFFHQQTIPDAFITMLVMPTPGMQTIPRAELSIVIQVLRHVVSCEIVTDSQYVIDVHQQLLGIDDISTCQQQRNFDLLQQLFDLRLASQFPFPSTAR